MSVVTVNDEAVSGWAIAMPRVGMWTADLRVDVDTEIGGKATIRIGDGLELVGTVRRGGVFALAGTISVVAGAGGMSKIAIPRYYNEPKVRSILQHLLGDAGEALSSTIDAGLLERQIGAWTTAAVPTGALVARLVATLGGNLSWRILPDGTFWMGEEAWPDSGFTDPGDYTITAEDPSGGSAAVASLAPLLLPGTTLEGRRISHVVKDNGVRGMGERVFFETEAAPGERMTKAWRGAVGADVLDVFYRGSYIGNVVQQEDDTVDIEFPGDDRLPSMAKVPLFAPGGTRQTGVAGNNARCVVAWGGADPAQPYVTGFDASAVGGTYRLKADTIVHEADQVFSGGEAGAEPAVKGQAYRAAQKAQNTTMSTTLSSMASACTGTLAPLQAGFLALATAVETFEALEAGFLATKAKVT